jgi:signal transduction histidine kinase
VAVADIVRFTADASHELRTPVSLIRTTAELALRRERGPADYRRALTEIDTHAQHMSGLVNDLLALARTDAGIEPHGQSPVDVTRVAAEAGSEIGDFAVPSAVTVRTSLPEEPVFVTGDEASLKRLLLILLENAVKYSRPGGEVNVLVQSRGDDGPVVIDVCDEGIGIEPSERSRLFERFYRGSRARQHAPDGTGLGLAIAHTIVERHRGTIEIGSAQSATGRGCNVTVRLPLAKPASSTRSSQRVALSSR